jgi:4-oxalocrotonate tautomerase
MEVLFMPFVHIEIVEGRSVDQKRRLAESVIKAVAESLNDTHPDHVHVIIQEMKKDSYARMGRLLIDHE